MGLDAVARVEEEVNRAQRLALSQVRVRRRNPRLDHFGTPEGEAAAGEINEERRAPTVRRRRRGAANAVEVHARRFARPIAHTRVERRAAERERERV